jgi:hypothetical protein
VIPAVDRDPWPSTYDRDLDVPRRVPTGPRGPIEPYRRLVVNPLPAVAMGVVAVLLLRASLGWRSLAGFLSALVLLGASPFLIQVHCLDCGATIWLLRSWRHGCASVLARWQEGRPIRWPFPDPKAQVVLWLHILASVAALLLILFASRR